MRFKGLFGFLLLLCLATGALAAPQDGVAGAAQTDRIVGVYECETGTRLTEDDLAQATMRPDEVLQQARGLCVLKKDQFDTLFCERGSCTGRCRLANFPLSCRCE